MTDFFATDRLSMTTPGGKMALAMKVLSPVRLSGERGCTDEP
ncbi:MAG TPA: hypothetical protein VMG59_08275 [Phycisphaerae bacterium]|nr:hypothetical protein [Phycisphaerae bacterium]